MTWASILAGVLRLFETVAGYFRERQLLDAGEARAEARYSAEERERINAANSAAVDAAGTERLPDRAYRD
jgi:hypothetical protein